MMGQMQLNFFGNTNNKFNKDLIEILNSYPIERDINLVSFIDQIDHIDLSKIKELRDPILLLPISNDLNYFDHISISWKLMINSAFYDWMNTCTSIFIISPGDSGTTPTQISNIILTMDTISLIDNIWVWPEYIEDKIYRDNAIENLSYQKIKSN